MVGLWDVLPLNTRLLLDEFKKQTLEMMYSILEVKSCEMNLSLLYTQVSQGSHTLLSWKQRETISSEQTQLRDI